MYVWVYVLCVCLFPCIVLCAWIFWYCARVTQTLVCCLRKR
jgi:hypothetical protein